jgi:hypothetical protein
MGVVWMHSDGEIYILPTLGDFDRPFESVGVGPRYDELLHTVGYGPGEYFVEILHKSFIVEMAMGIHDHIITS